MKLCAQKDRMDTKQEQWHIDGMRANGTCELSVGETTIAPNIRIDYAARIVACINACAGMRADDLAMGVTLKLPRDDERSVNIGDLRAQVAELTGALVNLTLEARHYHNTRVGGTHLMDSIVRAEAALAKVGKP